MLCCCKKITSRAFHYVKAAGEGRGKRKTRACLPRQSNLVHGLRHHCDADPGRDHSCFSNKHQDGLNKGTLPGPPAPPALSSPMYGTTTAAHTLQHVSLPASCTHWLRYCCGYMREPVIWCPISFLSLFSLFECTALNIVFPEYRCGSHLLSLEPKPRLHYVCMTRQLLEVRGDAINELTFRRIQIEQAYTDTF